MESSAGLSKCKRCGSCCMGLIIEFDIHDVLREPKLRPYFPNTNGRDEWEIVGVLPMPCPFLLIRHSSTKVFAECIIYGNETLDAPR
jgi:hypothetical protein